MKILIVSLDVWNDKIHGNNVISNWFEGMDAEFANIYCEPGEPFNKCCKKYFQITDMMMLKSIFTKKKAGMRVEYKKEHHDENIPMAEQEPKKLYSFLKSISGAWLRLVREILWILGKYDLEGIKKFIDDFQPDIIFTERTATCKMLRLEKEISKISQVPMVAFTGDDEYSLRQFNFSPFFWINRFMVRKRLREMVKKYKIYYTLSKEQKEDYETRFGCKMKILQKCGNFPSQFTPREVNQPIRIIYAGKLYCNRWKALAQIVEAIKIVNKDENKIVLEIYTKDRITKKQDNLLNDGKNSKIMGSVTQEKLREIYQNSDIALHVESQDLKNKLVTRLSFSTKIVDCLESGCAVMAVCWNEHSGYTYLQRENAAICVSSFEEILDSLQMLADDKDTITQYAKKAYDCGVRNHTREKVQKMIKEDFLEVINR